MHLVSALAKASVFLFAAVIMAEPPGPFEPVNTGQPGRIITPVNQVLTPAGIQVELPKMRPQAIALRSDGKLLATSGKTHQLILVDPVSGKILQQLSFPSEKATNATEAVSSHILEPDKDGQLSFTGLIFSHDGKRIYLSNVNGDIKVFEQKGDLAYEPAFSIPLPPTGNPQRKSDIPAGLWLSENDERLFIALNLSNRLLEVDARSGKQFRLFDVGVAPFDVVVTQGKAFVSNWGGRRPGPNDVTGPAGRGTKVRVDPVRQIANEGSVSIIDLKSGKIEEILLGLHSSAMALGRSGRYLAIANAGSDTISILDTRKNQVVETISLRIEAGAPFGASPNALAFSPDEKTLYVCNGTQNAVAVVRFKPGHSRVQGLIPTGWYPGGIAFDKLHSRLHVANIKGFGSGKRLKPGEKVEFNSHQYFGSLSLIDLPKRGDLSEMSKVVLENMRRSVIKDAFLPARKNQPARPVPERVGEPSVFQHVVYIIKENRTYDQVLGDIKEGNGSTDLCIFGEKYTPNQHKLAREFVLLDNTYCSGILSSEGHNWATAAFSTDYLERSFAGFPRSYPDGMEESDIDALAYSPAGFIWDNALANGKTIRSYGEFTMGNVKWKDKKGSPRFKEMYDDFVNGTGLVEISCVPAIGSLTGHIMTNTIGWDLSVPDVYRAAQFIKELKAFEQNGGFPDLSIICLPNNHTSGTSAHYPKPGSMVADNDLALGQIIEAITKSKFWTNTCVFVIEDDPQAGWDHVSGFRTTAFVVSPYTKRKAVVSNNYNQTGMIRTMELILGLPPMNQMDASSAPMFECFKDKPDFTPFTHVMNQVPLDELNPSPKAINDPIRRNFAMVSASLPLHKMDACPEDTLNRILWNAMRGSQALYPAWALSHVSGDDDDDD
ncbi:MAG: alkaline phosphatase family protein [Verrucomicrobiota bacterium]